VAALHASPKPLRAKTNVTCFFLAWENDVADAS